MTKKKTILLLAILCASVVLGQGNTNSEKWRIAVYLTATDNVDSEVRRVINNQIINSLTKTGRYEMIERNEAFVKQIDKERVTQLSGRVSDDQITKLGKEFGAVAICIVDVGDFKGELTLDMRIVSVEKATVIRSGYSDGSYDGISDIRKIVDKATADMLETSVGGNTNTTDNPTDAKAQFDLATKYFASKDYAETLKWLRKSAEQGNSDAQKSIGMMYQYGFGVTKDYAEAVKWYRKSAEQENKIAQNLLGDMYKYGYGVTKDYTVAVKLYRKSAEQGYGEAENNLGGMYKNGDGVTQNYGEAVKWFSKSAERGNASAQFELGYMYFNGYGVTKNEYEAVKWFRKGTEQGNSGAQYALGMMYQFGWGGLTKSETQAIELYKKAAKQGHKQAISSLKSRGITSY